MVGTPVGTRIGEFQSNSGKWEQRVMIQNKNVEVEAGNSDPFWRNHEHVGEIVSVGWYKKWSYGERKAYRFRQQLDLEL